MDNHSVLYQLTFVKPYLLVANTQVVTVLILLLAILLVLSFFVSSAKVSFFSLSYRDINMLKTKQHPSARRIITLLDQPKRLYSTLQITNIFVNIGVIIVGNVLADEFLTNQQNQLTNFIIKLLAILFLILLFAEMLPKLWATQNNVRAAYSASLLTEVLDAFFGSTSNSFVKISDRIEKSAGGLDEHQVYKTEDLDEAIELNTSPETTEEEKNILRSIVRFGHVTVRQIMRTRLDVSAVAFDTSFTDLVKKVQEVQYSRLPVYKSSLDEIAGVIQTKDILPHLEKDDSFDWHTLIRPAVFVPEQNLIKDLLRELQKKSIHFAVVVDEFGGTEGIVTMEDIMEEIVGDIRDEFDDEESINKKLDDNTYIFEGRISITDACKAMKLPLNTFDEVRGDSESVAGLVLELIGEIPTQNQEVSVGDFLFTVLEIAKNRIRKVKITVKPVQA